MHWNNVFLGCLLKTRLDFAIGATRSVQFRVWGDAQVSTDQKVGPFVWWGLRAGTTQCSVLSSTVCRHRCAPGRHGPELGAPHQKPHGQFFPVGFPSTQTNDLRPTNIALGSPEAFHSLPGRWGPLVSIPPLERGSGRGLYAAAKPRAWWGKALLPSQEPLFLLRIWVPEALSLLLFLDDLYNFAYFKMALRRTEMMIKDE